MKRFLVLTLLTLVFPMPLFAQTTDKTVSFGELWEMVKQHSPALRAVEYELKAAQIGENRAGDHWFPRLFADARAFETNDPALSFMSVLEERQIAPADFAASALNNPQGSLFERGTLGLDFPLFEGGAKVAMADVSIKAREAKEQERYAVVTGQYAQLVGYYASLLVLGDEQENLTKLSDRVGEILKSYSIGSQIQSGRLFRPFGSQDS